jgi:hypothetical protein
MKCIINDGKDAVSINNIIRYCYEHYQIYDSIQSLYKQISSSDKSISWRQFLTKALDTNFNASWKISLVDTRTGITLDKVANVARAELEQKGN